MDQTSSLTSLDALSTPESFYTAKGSRSPVDATTDTTAISTPVKDEEPIPFRDAKLIPHELKQHCQIHLEEELYSQAIQLFNGFLSDGNKPNTTRPQPAARIPTPAQLALLNTLTIHPSYTSRAPERSHLHISAHAFTYLRGLLCTVGPINANLRSAFAFSGSDRGSGRGKGYSSGSDEDSDSDWIGNRYATEQSLWRRAPDFWTTLGWAFQCASAHPHRWRSWKQWVHFMIEVLEKDWDERLGQEEEEAAREEQQTGSPRRKKEDKDHPHHKLRGSLIVNYLDDLNKQRKQPAREVMRALMAFLDVDSSADNVFYKEVFHGETAIGPRKNKRKRAQTVDIENDQFGDYLDRIDDFESEEEEEGRAGSPGLPTSTKAPRRGRRAVGGTASKRQPKKEVPAFQLSDSVAETIPLRLRIFRLLSGVAAYLEDKLVEVSELYQMFSDRIRALPLPTFKLFIGFHTTKLPAEPHVSLLVIMAEDLLPGYGVGGSEKRPYPAKVDKEASDKNGISGIMLQKCYLPFASNRVTAEDNAQLSLVLESMLWHVYSNTDCEYTEDLKKAVEKGIRAREDKIRRKGGSGASVDGNDKAAREVLERSARSLRVLIDVWSQTSA